MDSLSYSVKLLLSYCALVLLSFSLNQKLLYLKFFFFFTLADNKYSPSCNWLKHM